MFYTHVTQLNNAVLFIGYDNDGRKFQRRVSYKPSLYLPSKADQSDYRTLDGKIVDKITLSSIREARDFVEKYKDIANFAIYGSTNYKYTYLNEIFPKEVPYKENLIRVLIIDIEVGMPKSGFENFVTAAPEPVTAITMRMNNRIWVFGYKEEYQSEGVQYILCKDEADLLGKFILAWKEWQPDVVTGWNVEFFDIPYLVNRIASVIDPDSAKLLSPWGMMIEKEIFTMGGNQQAYVPLGVSILDYLQLYKKFTYTQQESYKLGHIAHIELGERKIDFSEYTDLDELYANDFKKYIDYNIHDVNLVYQLDEKLKLISLVLTMAYDAKINFNDTLGSVLPWEIVIHNYLLAQNIVVPFKTKHEKTNQYEGAHVKEPKPGQYEWVVSFDLTSLYPHLIIQYNISPETYKGKDFNVTVEKLLKNEIDFSGDTSFSHAANGCRYDNLRTGFLPALMKRYFAKRKEYKNKMLEYEKRKAAGEKVDNEIAKYNTAQMAMKIFLNSAYGAIGNQYFIFYNQDNAEAITLSGQLTIRAVENHINRYLNKKLGTDEDYVIAMDTDSLFLRLGPVVDRYVGDGVAVSRVVDILDRFSEEILQSEIDQCFIDLAKQMNAHEMAMSMKREVIASKAIWRAKKHYIMSLWDVEGVRYKEPQLKLKGVEAVRSNSPEMCRDALKDCYAIILNNDNAALLEYIKEFREKHRNAHFTDIGTPSGVKHLAKYSDSAKIYGKGAQAHIRGSLIYNWLLKKHNLPLTPIFSGDKIKWTYLKMPNPIHQNVISAPDYLPKEFGLGRFIDEERQYDGNFLQPLKSITDLIGWKVEESFSLEDFFA